MDSEKDNVDCTRCHANIAAHAIREENLCRDCFVNRVGIKFSKRMESLRVSREPVKNVLLSISFGCCSLSLLGLLDKHLRNQREKTQRVGYQLFVFHLLGADAREEPASAAVKLDQLQKMFPHFSFSSMPLEEGFGGETSESSSKENSADIPLSAESLQGLSASSYEDMMLIIRNRLIMKQARHLSCTSVLYGDSMSKLTERILAETAKGRGFALPQLIGDAMPEGEVTSIYPLRDIFRGEMEEYARAVLPEIWELVATSGDSHGDAGSRVPSSRNMTIDKLMAQYVTEMEGTTPSVVTNVLRTSAKLQQPQRELFCQVCGLAFDEGSSGLRGWGGDQDIELGGFKNAPGEVTSELQLCYGCTRSLQGG